MVSYTHVGIIEHIEQTLLERINDVKWTDMSFNFLGFRPCSCGDSPHLQTLHFMLVYEVLLSITSISEGDITREIHKTGSSYLRVILRSLR